MTDTTDAGKGDAFSFRTGNERGSKTRDRGITESVMSWRTDVPAKIVDAVGTGKVMFEAADPAVFSWYIKNFGPEVNLFVDHSPIVRLKRLRSEIWGTKSLWGRVATYKG
jgi:phosphosulfolactate synthase (CoM biosynthesis protein A)